MNRQQIASVLLAQKIILDALKGADADTRAQATELFERVGNVEVGEVGGIVAGKVRLKAGSDRVSVADLDAFQAWVEQNHPHQIHEEVRRTVYPTFTKAILSMCEKDGGLVDEEGEVTLPPGVKITPGNPTIAVEVDKNARHEVLRFLANSMPELQIEGRQE